jgi:predicted RNase H-like nuclease (RuvC/YqgF family)
MTTDTPRTDAASFSSRDPLELLQTSQQLERELAASKDEVEELQQQKRNCMEIIDDDAKEKSELKAEVEHIKTLLKDIPAVHANTLRGNIATLSWDSYEHIIGPHPCRERAEKAEAEAKEIRSALGDDGRRTHKEILEMAFKASGWKLWKEKYIDLRNAHMAEGQDPAGTIWEHADKLQKELKASKAEVERLTDRMKKAEDLIKGLHDGWKKARVAHLETCKNTQTEIDRLYGTNVCLQESEAGWKTEADKADQRRLEAETEVERLIGILKSLRKSPSTEWHKSNKVLLK